MADSQASTSRAVLCPCGAGICPLLTSKTPKNPGRQFYRCPVNRCRFFKWLDQVESHQVVDIPVCACGAGICRIETEASGPNAVRNFYVCPIEKGQGACNYFRWQDDSQANAAMNYTMDESFNSSPSILTISIGTSPSNNNQVEEGEPTDLGHKMEPFIAEAPQFSKSLLSTSNLLKRDKIPEELNGSEYTSDEPRRKHCKRVRHGVSESNGIAFGSSSECWVMLHSNFDHSLTKEPTKDSFHAPKMEINEKMEESRDQSFIQETVLAVTCSFMSSRNYSSTLLMKLELMIAHQDMFVQQHGWLGRLVFRLPRCLMEPAPKPFFCCVFPSFDPIFVSEQVKLCNDHVPASSVGSSFSAISNSLLCPQKGSFMTESISKASSAGSSFSATSNSLLCPQKSSFMPQSISKAFAQAAKDLQKNLLTLLKSMDIQDYETMSQEANATFAALDQLQINHKQFSRQVKEFICYASLLAKIDQCISNDHSCQLLLDRLNGEKIRLHEIDDTYAKGVEACLASKQRLMLLSEEVSHLKEKLSQIESELSSCKAENLALEARIAHIREERGKVWQTFQLALKELKNAYKLRESIEAKQITAKAAFEKAQMVLWG